MGMQIFIFIIGLSVIMILYYFLFKLFEENRRDELTQYEKHKSYILISFIIILSIIYAFIGKNTFWSIIYFLITSLYIVYNSVKYSKKSPLYKYSYLDSINLYSELIGNYNAIMFFVLISEKVILIDISIYILEFSVLFVTISYLLLYRFYKDKIDIDDKSKMRLNILVSAMIYLLIIFVFQKYIKIKFVIFVWLLLITLIVTSGNLKYIFKYILFLFLTVIMLFLVLVS